MCKNCGCETTSKPVQYQCQCTTDDCSCGIIEFDEVPKATPYCCGIAMKRVK